MAESRQGYVDVRLSYGQQLVVDWVPWNLVNKNWDNLLIILDGLCQSKMKDETKYENHNYN